MKRSHPPNPITQSILVGLALLAAGVLCILACRPSPRFNLANHWRHLGLVSLPSIALMAASFAFAGRRIRGYVVIFSALIISLAVLLHPVCIPISDQDRASFEAVIPLKERAARGEPFRFLEGRWYQCKPFLARAMFF